MKRLVLIALVGCHSTAEPTTIVIPPAPSSSSSPPVSSPPPIVQPTASSDDSCRADSDCDWGEIGYDITKTADCMCLLGCAGLAQNKSTIARRWSQYQHFCKPGQDGAGRHCPIDDCAPPPPIKCIRGTCGRGPRP